MGDTIKVESPDVVYTEDYITTVYNYQTTKAERIGNNFIVKPVTTAIKIRTQRHVPKLGIMLVGWGGNNGSTLTAALIANKNNLKWNTKTGVKHSNWYGSIIQSSTCYLGTDSDKKPIYTPISNLLPFVNPNDIIVDGWDISSLNLDESMRRSQVLDYELQKHLSSYMKQLKPRPGIYDADFIALNQSDRVDNVIVGNKYEQLQQIRQDIVDFKNTNNLDKIIVMWTANTERFTDVVHGGNDTAEALINSIKTNSTLVSPSTIYAVASILEGCTFINGSPQNTFVPGCIELASQNNVFIAGDDFKSGQTKLKSVLVDFLVNAGIKPVSIVSYNHLGNNDGKNLSSPKQFQSKEISKTNVVDDIVTSNTVLYKSGERPDHCVVIKYVPYVGDSKRAMDEYTSEILMGGQNTLVIHNTCEDSLLAAPIILDLILISEMCERITFTTNFTSKPDYKSFHSILSILSYLCKAPLVPSGTPIVNSLFKQRSCIENIFKACIGLPPDNNMLLEYKVNDLLGEMAC